MSASDDIFIAKEPLYWGTALSHNPGDEVSAENVERNGWRDLVVRPGTKTAKRVQSDPDGASSATPEN